MLLLPGAVYLGFCASILWVAQVGCSLRPPCVNFVLSSLPAVSSLSSKTLYIYILFLILFLSTFLLVLWINMQPMSSTTCDVDNMYTRHNLHSYFQQSHSIASLTMLEFSTKRWHSSHKQSLRLVRLLTATLWVYWGCRELTCLELRSAMLGSPQLRRRLPLAASMAAFGEFRPPTR